MISTRFTAHQHCGAATYVFVRYDGTIVPVNRIVDVDSLFDSVERMAETLRREGTLNTYKALAEGVRNIHDSVSRGEQGNTADFWRMVAQILIRQNFNALKNFHQYALFIGTMHFMDPSAPTTAARYTGREFGKNLREKNADKKLMKNIVSGVMSEMEQDDMATLAGLMK